LCARCMQFNRDDGGIGITVCDCPGLSSRRRTAIEDARASPDQRCDQLRCLVLNCNLSVRILLRLCDIPVDDAPRIGEKAAGGDLSLVAELFIGLSGPAAGWWSPDGSG
jgi:hypothetical protein